VKTLFNIQKTSVGP